MDKLEFEARLQELKTRAHGRWTEILRTLGVGEKVLNKRNQPCPMCGGTDRFQYTDKFGEGNYHCRGCGAGGGLKLLQGYHGWDFGTTFRRVEECVGSVSARPRPRPSEPSAERMKKLAKRLWEEAKPITVGDEVDRYLRNRGLQLLDYPKTLRCHPALGYYEKDASGRSKKVCEYPAMLACIQKADGHAVTLHRTYLKDGKKALGRESKKVLSAGINGARWNRTPNTSNLYFDGIDGEALVIALDLRGFAVSTGAACSSGALAPSHVLKAIGLSDDRARSSMRFSLGRANTAEQVDGIVGALEASVAHLRRISVHA